MSRRELAPAQGRTERNPGGRAHQKPEQKLVDLCLTSTSPRSGRAPGAQVPFTSGLQGSKAKPTRDLAIGRLRSAREQKDAELRPRSRSLHVRRRFEAPLDPLSRARSRSSAKLETSEVRDAPRGPTPLVGALERASRGAQRKGDNVASDRVNVSPGGDSIRKRLTWYQNPSPVPPTFRD